MLRALLLTTAYPTPAFPVAGIFHRTAARALARLGAEVEVLAPVPYVPPGLKRFRDKWKRYAEIPRSYFDETVLVTRPRYLEVPRGKLLVWSHTPVARLLGNALETSYDVVHAHYAYPCGAAMVKACRGTRMPTILTLHGDDINTDPYENPRLKGHIGQAVRAANEVIAVSGELARHTASLFGRLPRVLPIGIYLAPYNDLPDRVSARRILGLPTEGTLALYVGEMDERKGVREFLTAMISLRDRGITGLLVGKGPLLGLASRVREVITVGERPNEQIPMFLAAADVMILPSYAEGMPTVLVEAGAARVPVIATNVGGIPEFLGENRGLLIQAKSSGEIIAAVQQLFSEMPATRERTRALEEYVRRVYDSTENARQLLAIYEEVRETFTRKSKDRKTADVHSQGSS